MVFRQVSLRKLCLAVEHLWHNQSYGCIVS